MLTQTISKQVVVNPSRILETGLAFWSSKVLLTAVNLGLFSLLAEGERNAEEIKSALNLQDRGLFDFLDSLVALKFLLREGIGEKSIYSNSLEADIFLDKKKTSYVGGLLEMANNRLYPFWNNLEDALKTGLPQNEVKNGGKATFEELYSDENRLKEFISGMAGTQTGNFIAFAKQFDFTGYYTHCDIGGASGVLSAQIAIHNPGMQCTTFDLPVVAPIAQENIDQMQLNDRVKIMSGNFFEEAFPKADIITMGNIMHDWNLEEKKALLKKSYDALPDGGALAVIENVIDDERKQNAFGLLMSLNMLIETPGGFDYTAADFTGWAKEVGFTTVQVMHLGGPSSALIAYK